jgi:hypothetical protein
MTFPILGGNGAVAGYEIANSLRFNDNDSAYLSRSISSSGSNTNSTISFWFKRASSLSSQQILFNNYKSSYYFRINLNSSSQLEIIDVTNGSVTGKRTTDMLFRDVSAYYHLMIAINGSEGSQEDRVKLYVNGNQITDWASTTSWSSTFQMNDSTQSHYIGQRGDSAQYFDGYISEFNYIDGSTKSPTDFGEFDTDSGIWKPISYSGSYGTNGFYLDFENSGSLGADQSGNGNNFTPTNLASTDQTTDTPTNNFATINSIDPVSKTLSEGNLRLSASSKSPLATFGVSQGKWYWETKLITQIFSEQVIGVCNESFISTATLGSNANSWGYIIQSNGNNGQSYHNGSLSSTYATFTANDILNIALDMDNQAIYFGKNGTWVNSGDPTSGASKTGAIFTNLPTSGFIFPCFESQTTGVVSANFGNPSFSISSGNSDDNGYGNFEYAPPSGYLALCTQNLATALSPTIDDGSQYFNTLLRNGTGASVTSITGVGFQPDFIWQKRRSSASSHHLTDSSRGATKLLYSELTNAEDTNANFVQSIDSDGFTMGSADWGIGDTVVAWNWKANAGTTSSNTDGSITSTVQANTTAGFSIVTYTGNGTSGATIGHSLGVVPNVMIVKMRTDAGLNWEVYHSEVSSTPQNDFLLLNSTSAKQTASNRWNNTAPTSSVFTVGNGGGVNSSTKNYVAYLFNNVEGYSKFGSYTGSGNTDGPYIYTGHKSQWLLIKNVEQAGGQWFIYDVKRETFNPLNSSLFAESSQAETSNNSALDIDILSNGWKIRNTGSGFNNSGIKYIYASFASNPFVTSSGVPVVAR